MIPLRLLVHNFMCYREGVPPLELGSVRLACLSGDNGAGKSALLDAITWALWGRARVNSDLDLMSLGATEMRVEFEFRLGDLDYKVARRRTRRGAATGWLDLFVLDPATGAWRSQSGDGVRQTQATINELLRMEYETFINSAFLLQGRADEFTTKPPAKRKEVLADILGLSLYDELEKKAREAYRARGDQLRELDGELERLQRTVEAEPQHQVELERLMTQVIDQDTRIERAVTDHAEARAQVADLQQQAQRLGEIETQIAADAGALERTQLRVAECRTEITRFETLLGRREEIEAAADRWQAAQQRRTELDGVLRTLTALTGQRHTLERAIERERSRLAAEQQHLTQRLTELNRIVATLPTLLAERERLAAMAATVTTLEDEIATRQEADRSAHGEIEALKARNNSLMTEMKRLKDRQRQVDAADAACPLCRRPLGVTEKDHLHHEYQMEGETLKASYLTNENRIKELERQSELWRQEVVELTQRRNKALLDARSEARLGTRIETARQAEIDQAATQLRLLEVVTQLERGAFAAEERQALARLTDESAALGYDEAAHEAARAAERELAHYADDRAQVREAARQLPRQRQQLAEHEATAAELSQRIERARGEAALLTGSVRALPALREREQALYYEIEALRRQRDTLQIELGRVQAAIAACQQARDDLAARQTERSQVAEERELYQELVEAFGKKGIQALIIESVVPELQDEANALLDRMPGNTMRVEFHTQRDGRSGDTIETLDVIIKDEVGARKYELYSGGEAFRVNFAIRVALSKLLARRAGARLQLLVVDEGFGTQDTRGREGLLEALRSIEEDFATILVITHLSDIKDEFPTHINVVKGLEGSSVALM